MRPTITRRNFRRELSNGKLSQCLVITVVHMEAYVVLSVVNIPLRAGANHQDLPLLLRDPRKLEDNGESKSAYKCMSTCI
jgi:hypothetical protein